MNRIRNWTHARVRVYINITISSCTIAFNNRERGIRIKKYKYIYTGVYILETATIRFNQSFFGARTMVGSLCVALGNIFRGGFFLFLIRPRTIIFFRP